LSLVFEEKYDHVRRLIKMGKERGYLLYDEVNDILPAEVQPSREFDLTPGIVEKANDPVRVYLCEMGTVPLLTREGEVAIAKRIERGQMLVLKTISRSSIMLKEILAIGEELRKYPVDRRSC
jgi:RNA polymerase primary sigma factor